MHIQIKNKKIISYICIIFASIIISIPLFNPNVNMQFNDGIQHICRLIGTKQSIEEGQIIPVIMSKFCNNFGYSWNLFYSPITSYIPLIFRLFTSSYEICMKIFIFLVNILTGLSMYYFLKKFLDKKLDDEKKELIALIGGILYILFPYRINDIYLRFAIAELTSFIFLPLVFNGLYTLINLNKKSYLLILGSVGMLLTHSLLTIYLAIFCFIYLIVNIKKLNKSILLKLLISGITILLITAFYWEPLLESKLSANYEVFNQEHMVRWDAMIALKPTISELLFNTSGRMWYGIGIFVILGTIASIVIIKEKSIDRKNYFLFLVFGVISVIMSLDFFPFEKLPKLFTMMQFSFRMLEFGGFFLIICASISICFSLDKLNKNVKLAFVTLFIILIGVLAINTFSNIQYGFIFLIIILICTLFLSITKFNYYTVIGITCISIICFLPNIKEIPYGRYYEEEDLINSIEVNSNTGRVHAGCASFEYLPTKAFENRKYIENRENIPIILSENTGKISNYTKDGTNCSFDIIKTEGKENLKIELPYIYYIGYNAEYVDTEGNKYNIQTYESENGFLCIDVPNENITVNVKYSGTTSMKLAYIISICSFISYIIYLIYVKNKKDKKQKI